MSVLKYIDPVTLEVKKVGAPKYDVYSKEEVYNKKEVNTLISEAISNAITTAIGGSY